MRGGEEKLGSKGAGRRGGEKDGEWGKGDEVKGWGDGGEEEEECWRKGEKREKQTKEKQQ